MFQRMISCIALAVAAACAPGCSFVDHVKNDKFNGITDLDGNAVDHLNVGRLGLNFFVSAPFIHDASLDATVDELTEEATAAGKKKVRIVQSGSSTYWWVLPPFSLILTPAYSEVAADVAD